MHLVGMDLPGSRVARQRAAAGVIVGARRAVAEVAGAALDLAVPGGCAGCGRSGGALCRDCRSALRRPGFLAVPDPAPPGLPPVWAVTPYGGIARGVLIAHKEGGRLSLVRPLGDALAVSLAAALAAVPAAVPAAAPAVGGAPDAHARLGGDVDPRGRLLVVPVPSSPASLRDRGHDPVRRTAARSLRRLPSVRSAPPRAGPRPVLAPVLHHARAVADQAGLTAAQRQANLHGALEVPPRWRPALSGWQAVLVDDVVTTGATLAAASAALRSAGVEVLAAATVAATERRFAPRARLVTESNDYR